MERTQLHLFANISAITYDNPKESKNKFKSFGFNFVEFWGSSISSSRL